jgi:glycosyltransferase involved in cell wall biosynthesis
VKPWIPGNGNESAELLMKRLRIVQTPVRIAPSVGGVEKYVLELSNQLAARGNEITIICADEPHANLTTIGEVHTIRLPYIAKVANTNITLKLFRALMDQDFDVIHTHIPTPWSADMSALVSLIKRKPLYVTYHNDLTGNGPGRIIAKAYNATLLSLVLARARKIIITQAKYLDYSKYLKTHKHKVVVIPLGVSTPAVLSTSRNRKLRHLFFLSVLDEYHEYKGLGILLRAVAAIRKLGSDVHLEIGGKGGLIESYRSLAKSLGVSDSVEFLGYIPSDELPERFASTSAFVLPSVNSLEGFGIVALEALSYGTPVITTKIVGSAGFIEKNKAGIVIAPGNVDQLVEAINKILEFPDLSASMGENGRRSVLQEFDWSDIAAQIAGLYEQGSSTPSKSSKLNVQESDQ